MNLIQTFFPLASLDPGLVSPFSQLNNSLLIPLILKMQFNATAIKGGNEKVKVHEGGKKNFSRTN